MKTFYYLLFVFSVVTGLQLLGCNAVDDGSPTLPPNQSPVQPFAPFPPHGSADQLTVIILSWSCSDPEDDPLVYNVYLGMDSIPQLIDSELEDTVFTPDTLVSETIYYWKIEAWDNHDNSTEGNVWQFKTGPPENYPPSVPFDPHPSEGAENVDTEIRLSWNCSDREGDSLIYDVYFGAASDPPLISSDQVQAFCELGALIPRCIYYWKIVAKDDHGNVTESPTWSFSTLYERDFVLDYGIYISMVWIPAGSFMMGRQNVEQDSEADEDPRHDVNIAHGFWMGKYEVTQAQWEPVMENNPSSCRGVNRPVETVSWDDIQQFLQKVNEGFRLPTESEWEYACRAGTTNRFYWGNDPDYIEINGYSIYSGNNQSGTADVGSLLPNAWNLYDMSGNVYEWCEDDYKGDYIDTPDDGSAWIDEPRAGSRVLRGGSWLSQPP